MKRYFCEKCSGILPKWKIVCDKCGYENAELLPVLGERKKHRKILRNLIIITAFVALAALLNANLLLPWQSGARRNKQIILRYATDHYPNAKIVDKEFNSAKLFVWNNFRDCIVFNLEGLEFGITAEGGEILVDGYYGARAIAQFDKIIQDGFLKPRGITAYTDYQFVDDYEEFYPYTGGLAVRITICDQGSTPSEVGRLYDFYKYWKNEGAFLTSYSVRIDIAANDDVLCHINYSNESNFSNEGAFYSAFKEGR